jgi:hypothetical protein
MSAQVIKQIRIKTSTILRLKKEYIYYQEQIKDIRDKLLVMESEPEGEDRLMEIEKYVRYMGLFRENSLMKLRV